MMRIFPLSDSAATIEFGNEISVKLNDLSIALSKQLETDPFEGMIEAVPAYASVTVFFDPGVATFATVKQILAGSFNADTPFQVDPSEPVEIPLTISMDVSLDLSRVAKHSRLSETEVLDIFLSQTFRVYMLGFLPGFAYMGEVDDRIAAPRLETPRTRVPRGSVGIAGKQTGIYPLESPGGWNIIGRTDLQMFDPTADPPCLLKPGEKVRFVRC